MEEENQKRLNDVTNKESQEDSESKMKVLDINPADLEEVESEHKDLTDFEKHRLEKAKIESAEIVLIPSGYSKRTDGKVHRLKITGEIVETVEIEDKQGNKKQVELRPSELVNLEEDKEGNLKGLPTGENSQWQILKKSLDIDSIKELIGKALPMRINVTKSGSKFLGFMY